MLRATQIAIPTLVRVKEDALDRVGMYLDRAPLRGAIVFHSQGLLGELQERLRRGLRESEIAVHGWHELADNALEVAARHFEDLPKRAAVVVGLGGGKALDVAKYVAFLARLPYYAVPTSLSNDGFCSPQASLTIHGKRRSVPAAMPTGVVVDTAVCRQAPRSLTLSGAGDLVAKLTAVRDWKLAFHATGEPVNDFAALLSDGALHAYRSHPDFDAEGIRLLATGLMLNGIAMEIAGSSRPASGSEHLISHALDGLSARPRLHGLQVGVAAYLVSRLQEQNTHIIDEIFQRTGFWDEVARDPFDREEWSRALRQAPEIKEHFHTVLSQPEKQALAEDFLWNDTRLGNCLR
ncbi:iron-containing alcohol dehydrogenase family protein [Planctomyces sp. SH-PL14]|uniref:iron-containing alcohol dehydrogenase family protein n=1 Tax=Planctomyces sp. SH-PL14 TaxID=1632864 RepID=UPI00078E4245|nr:iron-containing alcohol dehydrogenase family protein [Planctomyces sp. SH-PL14]AMV18309.1 Glycerol-1-phosphate dehydrogenase [NAD(P)+] [Planctomyces sp. SH-PL14]